MKLVNPLKDSMRHDQKYNNSFSMSHITEECFSIGSLRFREEELPDRFDFDITNFAEYIAFAAPCGGALAFMKNPSLHLMLGIDKTRLDFQSAYGDKIARMDTTHWKDVKKVGWTLSEHFIVIFGEQQSTFAETGTSKIEVYNIKQELVKTYSLPSVCVLFSTEKVFMLSLIVSAVNLSVLLRQKFS